MDFDSPEEFLNLSQLLSNHKPRELRADEATCDPDSFADAHYPKPLAPIIECPVMTVKPTLPDFELFSPVGYDAERERKLSLRIVHRLLASGPFSFVSLPDVLIPGNGVYAIYYHGPIVGRTALYEPLVSPGATLPIYIGKTSGDGLQRRLKQHYDSLVQTGLGIENFTFRFIVLNKGWVEHAEVILVDTYDALWNGYLTGFGNRNSGKQSVNRNDQTASAWDTWHPGRVVASGHEKMQSLGEIEFSIRKGIVACRAAYSRIATQLQIDPEDVWQARLRVV